MKTQKLMLVLASVALGVGLAGCAGNADASAPVTKVPTISDMDREKQVLNAERGKKIARDYAARAKAKAKTEAEAPAKANKAQAPAPVKAQPKSRTYQKKAQPKRQYQAPRRSGTKAKAGNSGEWKVGESKSYKDDSSKWTYKGNNQFEVSRCGDSEGNTWPC
ncbi:hypothetical protein [Varibaculum cambriense]